MLLEMSVPPVCVCVVLVSFQEWILSICVKERKEENFQMRDQLNSWSLHHSELSP